MKLRIHNHSDIPIYQQLYEQIKNSILCGDLSERDQLPTMRYLAKELRISVVTTKRVYDELEKDGLIYSIQGKGSFVAARNKEIVREEYLRKVESSLIEALKYRILAGLSIEELKSMIDILEVTDE
ncbi:MAG: GntR family transcriptional regulator [Peptostreptococcaceae bacterium]|nr:GntR family transcriptional regulator [Peptostreptococcaceae bacterium]SFD99232.1 GntR family transcriptional regulator [Peptostreptococcaceae bacterium pGA-8]